MTRRPLPLLASIALASAAVPALAPSPLIQSAEAQTRTVCASVNSKTVRQTADVRIFRKHRKTYACRYRTGRKFRLGDEDCFPDRCVIGPLRLAGPFVGYELRFGGRHGYSSEVRVRDLRSGRYRRLVVRRTGGGCMTSPGPLPEVTDIELKGNGSVAWILRFETCGRELVGHEVRRAPSSLPRSSSELLDSGTGVVPASLSLSGGTIAWLNGEQPHSAPLR